MASLTTSAANHQFPLLPLALPHPTPSQSLSRVCHGRAGAALLLARPSPGSGRLPAVPGRVRRVRAGAGPDRGHQDGASRVAAARRACCCTRAGTCACAACAWPPWTHAPSARPPRTARFTSSSPELKDVIPWSSSSGNNVVRGHGRRRGFLLRAARARGSTCDAGKEILWPKCNCNGAKRQRESCDDHSVNLPEVAAEVDRRRCPTTKNVLFTKSPITKHSWMLEIVLLVEIGKGFEALSDYCF